MKGLIREIFLDCGPTLEVDINLKIGRKISLPRWCIIVVLARFCVLWVTKFIYCSNLYPTLCHFYIGSLNGVCSKYFAR